MAGVTKFKICELAPNINDVMIVAIIITKQEPRIVAAWKGVGSERSVWNFTIRDSPQDTMNVSVWGSVEYIKELANIFSLGDVVEITNARVSFRQGGGQEDKFNPYVSSELTLTLDETHSRMESHSESDVCAAMSQLFHVPTKPTTEFFTLGDVERRGLQEQPTKDVVDLLVAISKVEPTRSIKRRDGSLSQVRDILLMDYTVNGMSMTLWSKDWIKRADRWRPGNTVLFIADATVELNSYKKRMAVCIGKRSVITEDPACTEADTLRLFAQQAPLQLVDQLDHITSNITNPKSINTVMTIKQVREILEQDSSSLTHDLYALIFCVPIALDLDGVFSVLATRCSECKNLVDDRVGICEQCDLRGTSAQTSSTFDMRVTLADHTDCLTGVRLSGITAEKVLGISANDFKQLPGGQKTALKWQFLLERCAVRIAMVQPGSNNQRRPLVTIIDCERADPREAAARYPVN